MAVEQRRVCDVCAKDAIGTLRIDVCRDHRRGVNGRSSAKLVACPKCGQKVREGAGLSAHMRGKHGSVAKQKARAAGKA